MPARDYNNYMKSYMLRRYHERRDEALRVLGNKCAQCSSLNDLEIDHVDWRTKTLALNRMWSAAKAKFDKELEKCQLLCKECHLEKSKQDIREIKLGA